MPYQSLNELIHERPKPIPTPFNQDRVISTDIQNMPPELFQTMYFRCIIQSINQSSNYSLHLLTLSDKIKKGSGSPSAAHTALLWGLTA